MNPILSPSIWIDDMLLKSISQHHNRIVFFNFAIRIRITKVQIKDYYNKLPSAILLCYQN